MRNGINAQMLNMLLIEAANRYGIQGESDHRVRFLKRSMLSKLPTAPKMINEMLTEMRNMFLMLVINNTVEDILLV